MGEWKHIITIGREYGAGGRSVAKRISDLLGIPHYDKEIIQLAAEKTGLSEEMIRGTEEHESGKTLLNWFLPSGSASAYDQAILAQAQTIRKIAEQGPCVIVGRGADYILRDFPHLVNVFLYAEKKDKVRYAMETYGESYEQGGPPGAPRRRGPGVLLPLPDKGQMGRLEKLPPDLEQQPSGQAGLCGDYSPVCQQEKRMREAKNTAAAPDQVPPPCFLTKKGVPQKRPKKGLTFPGISGRIP